MGQGCGVRRRSQLFAGVFLTRVSFIYQAVSSDGGGGIASYGNKQGTWKLKGATINVVLDNNNRAFTIRPLLWGRLLWATDGFGEDIGVDVVGVPIWGKC
jgi:hypothetical protein